MLQFLCKFAFYQLYRLSNRTPKITRILKITRHTQSVNQSINIRLLRACQKAGLTTG